METAFVITPHVINTINSLPQEERLAVTSALAMEMILGVEAKNGLTPMEKMLYAMIKSYVNHDTERHIKARQTVCAGNGRQQARNII